MTTLAEVGAALRGAGLVPRALASWAGTDRIPLLAGEWDRLAATPPTVAAAALQLFVAGTTVSLDRLRLVARLVDDLVRDELVERVDTALRARVAILPIGHSLVVCDRADAPPSREHVPWPDDSSFHLAASIPRGTRWIDLGCGSAVAMLAHPERATTRLGIDLNPRAIDFARLGAALSHTAIAVEVGDLAAATGSFDIVSCNAPIANDASSAMWRSTDPSFFDRLWPTARRLVAPNGTIVVHASYAQLSAIPRDGQLVIVRYADFGVAWWRPDAPARVVEIARELTVVAPHVGLADRDAALSVTVRGA